jgi:hypothetical protein
MSGMGFQVRAEVVCNGLDYDLLNNHQTGGWLLSDMEIIKQ